VPQRNAVTVLRLRTRALANRTRESLLVLPALLLLAAIALSVVMAEVDERLGPTGLPLSLRMSPDAAISLLATIAGATITTAGVVFSILVVSLQLASGQFSPRVLRGFYRDRFGQLVIGLLVATFAYCVLALRAVRPGADGTNETPELTVDVAVLLAVTVVFAIVGYLDRISRRQYVGRIAHRILVETVQRIDALEHRPLPSAGIAEDGAVDVPDCASLGPAHVVPAPADGWVQQVSSEGLLDAVPPGSVVRLETRAGAYLAAGMPLATIWPPPANPRQVDDELVDAVVIGETRTMQEDIDFGLRQLNDIGLRALSPAVNDPTTAIETSLRVASVLRRLLLSDLPPQVLRDRHGSVLLRPWDLDHGEFIDHAYDQMRYAAAASSAVAITLVRSLRMLMEAVTEAGRPHLVPALRRQLDLTLAAVEATDLLAADKAAVAAADRPQSAAGGLVLSGEEEVPTPVSASAGPGA